MERRRRILSALLLAVILPAIAVTSLHRHDNVSAPQCQECVNHQHHQGHLGTNNGGIDNCVLCHFLGLPYVATAASAFIPAGELLESTFTVQERPSLDALFTQSHTRAPPAFLI